jgi:preprotein translocase subunit SecD
VSLTLRAQPEGVFTFVVPGLDGVRGDEWLEDHYPRIGQQLTTADIGTDEIKEISLEGQQLTVRTLAADAADCERQADRIELLLSDLYEEVTRVDAKAREVGSWHLDEVEHILETRGEAAGLSDLSVARRPPDSLLVEFACAGDPKWAKALLTDAGLLQFRVIPRRYAHGTDRGPEVSWAGGRLTHTFQDETGIVVDASDVVAESPVIVSGRDLAPTSRVEAGPDRPTGVTFSLRDEAREAFYVFTRDHVDTYLAMVFDGELISCPIIRSAIPGDGVIIGDFDEPGGREEAEKLAILINSGPLPLDLECVESTTEQLPP